MTDPTRKLTMLAIDIGTITTRTFLFDAARGNYGMTGYGTSPTTLLEPFFNILPGIQSAIEELQAKTGRYILDDHKRLLKSSTKKGKGVDACAVTISAGRPMRVLAAGLLRDASLKNAKKLAKRISAGQVDTLVLEDTVHPETWIDRILNDPPDLIIIAGGIEGGASKAVLRLIEPIFMAHELLPDIKKPYIMFAGNQALHSYLRSQFHESPYFYQTANIQPELTAENLDPAVNLLVELQKKLLLRQVPGLPELVAWTDGHWLPHQAAFSRIIRFLSQVNPDQKGVMGVDLGASATTIGCGWRGSLALGVYPEHSLSINLEDLVDTGSQAPISDWLTPADFPDETVPQILINKSLYPASLPVTQAEMAVQEGLVRLALQSSIQSLEPDLPAKAERLGDNLLPTMEPILLSGGAVARAQSLGRACLAVLDGLQPAGITTLILDKEQIIAALGIAAEIDPLLPVQLFDTGAFVHLCTVIAPVGEAPAGTPILRIRVNPGDEHETTMDVKQGELEVIPLAPEKLVTLHLQPFYRYDIGMGGQGRGGSLKVSGSILGVVIDGRGRPFRYNEDRLRREAQFLKWIWTLGG